MLTVVVLQAVLRVPGGDSVTATGSSKKIAKNLAAKLMLDKLDSKKSEESQVSVNISIICLFSLYPLRLKRPELPKTQETTTTIPLGAW